MARHAWGRGYATGPHSALAHGFTVAGLSEIVSFTAVPNQRSQADQVDQVPFRDGAHGRRGHAGDAPRPACGASRTGRDPGGGPRAVPHGFMRAFLAVRFWIALVIRRLA
ncbi:GNAT family N-acetyltransferase [Actinomadura rubrobrunea]|uniref:GNAT family N-acetyltransferase n=1 Tax=Actinomadura rubrobrunea TaxID=115335 RepID=UPI001FE0B405|nr:GNAT family N-acetyltransferase [Actinomadura rubrobrunea]